MLRRRPGVRRDGHGHLLLGGEITNKQLVAFLSVGYIGLTLLVELSEVPLHDIHCFLPTAPNE